MATKVEQVQALLNVEPNMICRDQVEWVLPETTMDRMPVDLLSKLRKLGAHVFNVDSSRAPYYWVGIRVYT